MNVYKTYGFRFMLLGVKNNLYAVKDLEDNGIEYFSKDKLLDIARKVEIMGVHNDNIDLNWFRYYYAKCAVVLGVAKTSELLSVFIDCNNSICAFIKDKYYKNSNWQLSKSNILFGEFITSHRCYSSDEMVSSLLPVRYTDAVLDAGCGFINITDNCKDFYFGTYNTKYIGKLQKFVNCSFINGEICFSGDSAEINGNEHLGVDNIRISCNKIELTGISSDIHYFIDCSSCVILKDNALFSNVKFLNTSCLFVFDSYNSVIRLLSIQGSDATSIRYMISGKRDVKVARVFNFLAYKFTYDDLCIYDSIIYFICNNRVLEECNIVPSKVSKEVYLKFEEEEKQGVFEFRHGISWSDFNKIYRVVS